MVTVTSVRRLKLVGGILAMLVSLVVFMLRWEFAPGVFLLQAGGTYLLASLGSDERWHERVGIAVIANAPIFLYLFVAR